ncbi:MAG TPA: DMT family transporter [Alphaproteobacteria bacterium]|nr:DMT family transporter [Alphaproteobacteria bacterium]HJM49184.1 DMT family transporter [Alphaproteobacteria bacterium]
MIPLRAIIIAVCIHILWGANPVAVKFGLLAFPPLWSAFIRFALAIACITVWACFKEIPLWPRRGEWLGLGLLSLLFTVQIALMNFGIDMTTSSMSSVLLATHPLFAALFAHLFIARDRLTPVKVVGLLVAFSGAGVVLLRDAGLAGLDLVAIGNWVVLLSSALLGGRLIYTAGLAQRIDTSRLMVWQMVLSLVAFGAGGLAFESIHWAQVGWLPLAGLAYQGIVIAGLGFMLNTWLIKHHSPSTMVSFGFIAPISGVALSVWLLGESLTSILIFGTLGVGLGLVLITRKAAERPL